MQVLDKVRMRQAAMQAATEAEDYASAAAERDRLHLLQLRQRALELEVEAEARVVLYDLGAF